MLSHVLQKLALAALIADASGSALGEVSPKHLRQAPHAHAGAASTSHRREGSAPHKHPLVHHKKAPQKLVFDEMSSSQNVYKTCTNLVNHGTHFTVEMEVGTPGQKFDVVADTGSDAIIVPSCACVRAGYCSEKSRCFQGTNKSKSFHIQDGPKGPPAVRMMFGSGPVQAVVASDMVRVGSLHTKMQDGLLLMTDQMLNIKGTFEGILGLGLPSSNAKKGLYKQSGGDGQQQQQQPPAAKDEKSESAPMTQMDDPKKRRMASEAMLSKNDVVSKFPGVNILPFPGGVAEVPRAFQQRPPQGSPFMNIDQTSRSFLGVAKPKVELNKNETQEMVVKGFMEEAGIKRFSMCFNDGANGVLRLGTPKAKHAHGSVGQVHWGLDFRGISVGNIHAPVKFCTEKEMKKGQDTPCGAIPDSGTTAFMAPKEHLISLFDNICDQWERCHKNHTAMMKAAKGAHKVAVKEYGVDPFGIQPVSKAAIFQQLVLDCTTWLSEKDGLDELPALHFHVGGANGTKQTLSLTGWSYIIETKEKEYNYTFKDVPGLGKVPIGKNATGKTKKVCSPAFSTMDYATEQNGPVWIMGTPIFYMYQVAYDLVSKPPSIAFVQEPCGSCGGGKKTSLVSKDVSQHGASKHTPRLRQVLGPLRVPNFDLSSPL